MDAKALKAKLQGNAIIRAALEQGDIRLIYKRKPELSDDLLFGTWTVEVLLIDTDFPELIANALKQLGFEVKQLDDKLLATFLFPISAEDRRAMDQRQVERDIIAKDRKHAAEIAALEQKIDELQSRFTAQLDDLLEEVTLQGLLPGKSMRGEPGPPGKDGSDGRDGKDLEASEVELQDLSDVSKIPAANGQVLMWSDLAQEWQPKRVSSGIVSISGGGGGGSKPGGGDGTVDPAPIECCPENPGPGGPDGGTNSGWLPKWWYETSTGDWMPRTALQNIGSAAMPVQEIFVSGGSIYMDGHKVALGEKNGEQRLTYDGNVLAYEFYTDDGTAIEPFNDAPRDGYHYVRKDGEWVRLEDVLQEWGVTDVIDGGMWSQLICSDTWKVDAGDFNIGQADGVNEAADAGNWDTGEIDDDWNEKVDGGNLN